MHAIQRFPLLGEPLALDLTNTMVNRDGQQVDLLATPAALTAWLRAEGARVTWRGRAGVAELAAVRALRDVIDRLLDALETHTVPDRAAVVTVNRALSRSAAGTRLQWTRGGPRAVPLADDDQQFALLRVLAADAVRLLTGAQAEQVRRCAHPDCRLRFLARNPRRRWCCGATCGNRARVARHYAMRQRSRRPD